MQPEDVVVMRRSVGLCRGTPPGRWRVRGVPVGTVPWEVPLTAITAPVDVWHGSDDTLLRPAAAELLTAAIPGSERHLLDGEGHFALILTRAGDDLAPFVPS